VAVVTISFTIAPADRFVDFVAVTILLGIFNAVVFLFASREQQESGKNDESQVFHDEKVLVHPDRR
jgi:hypothetical protein